MSDQNTQAQWYLGVARSYECIADESTNPTMKSANYGEAQKYFGLASRILATDK